MRLNDRQVSDFDDNGVVLLRGVFSDWIEPLRCSVDGKQVCSMWIPLDPVPVETCPEFVAGSHLWGKWFLPRKFSGIDYDHPDSRLEPVPDIEASRDRYDIRSWALEPGDPLDTDEFPLVFDSAAK